MVVVGLDPLRDLDARVYKEDEAGVWILKDEPGLMFNPNALGVVKNEETSLWTFFVSDKPIPGATVIVRSKLNRFSKHKDDVDHVFEVNPEGHTIRLCQPGFRRAFRQMPKVLFIVGVK